MGLRMKGIYFSAMVQVWTAERRIFFRCFSGKFHSTIFPPKKFLLFSKNDFFYRSHLHHLTMLTLPMLRLFSSKAKECKILEKTSKPCRLSIHLKALAEYSQMSTHLPGFQLGSSNLARFLHLFVFAKLATSSIRVNMIVQHFFSLPSRLSKEI